MVLQVWPELTSKNMSTASGCWKELLKYSNESMEGWGPCTNIHLIANEKRKKTMKADKAYIQNFCNPEFIEVICKNCFFFFSPVSSSEDSFCITGNRLDTERFLNNFNSDCYIRILLRLSCRLLGIWIINWYVVFYLFLMHWCNSRQKMCANI